MTNPAEQALIDANIKTKDCFATIRAGGAFVNPVSGTISSLESRAAALLVVANAILVPTTPITALIANLTSLSMSLTALLTHTNIISGAAEPGPTDSPYNFQARQGLLTGALHLLNSNIDVTDTETTSQKTHAFFGSILGDASTVLANISTSFTNLEALTTDPIAFAAQAVIENPLLVTYDTTVGSFASSEDQTVVTEAARLHVYVLANTAIALTQNPDTGGLINAVASPTLKANLGI